MDFKQRFEPKGNKVIHGAGQQSPEDYRNYWKTVGKYKPLLYMTYVQIKWPDEKWFRIIRNEIKEFPNVLFQIGLSMSDTPSGEPEKHYEHEVAEGKYDDKIDNFCKGIKSLKVPVFVRPAYEFNGLSWYGYKPKTFIKAWKHLIDKAREHKVNNVAWIWHYAPEGVKNYMDYYPGDDYVDWWGISLFKVEDIKDPYTKKFLQDAKKHKKPVIIAESSARGVGVLKGEESWNKWFKPYYHKSSIWSKFLT